jgi:hypothetical protein
VDVVVEELVNELDVGQEHTTAAVAGQAQVIEGLPGKVREEETKSTVQVGEKGGEGKAEQGGKWKGPNLGSIFFWVVMSM